MKTPPPSEFHDPAALHAVHLIDTLDSMIGALQGMLPPKQPWQRQLLMNLEIAYQQMQILRMTEALSRPDEEVGEAANMLSLACRKMVNAVQGSRADGLTRNAVGLAAQVGHELATLMRHPPQTRPLVGFESLEATPVAEDVQEPCSKGGVEETRLALSSSHAA